MTIELKEFLAAGVQEVWVVDPDHFRLHAYQADDEPTIFNRDDKLMSAFLPAFECTVNDLFRGLD